MKLFTRPVFVLVVHCMVFLSSPGIADESVHNRIKERLLERQRQKPNPAADAGRDLQPVTSGDHIYTIQHGGLKRMYRIHVPAAYDVARPVPVVFALHGGGGSMDYQANDAYYGLITKSEQEGFVAVFPNGFSKLPGGKLATWNAGNCCGGARDANADDVGFIREVVADVTRRVNVDRSRIYATGMSNGGLMSYRLACEMSDVFSAIAPVAGTDNTQVCSPERAVSVLHIHARNDNHVLFDGGAGPGARDKSKVTDFTSVPATLAKWVGLNGCAPTPRRILDKPGVYCEVYAPCRDGAEVQLCVTDSGGHSWPGGHKPRGGEAPSQAVSANDVMWDFFARH
ncbi:MAG: PHB depolymerase family esterase [Pseudomonadota bacterium]